MYELTTDEDNTLKQFFERFYCISKNINCTEEQRLFLESKNCKLEHPDITSGKDGYIVFRYENKHKRKIDKELVKKIKEDKISYREKVKKYKISLGTINKIMNDKYLSIEEMEKDVK